MIANLNVNLSILLENIELICTEMEWCSYIFFSIIHIWTNCAIIQAYVISIDDESEAYCCNCCQHCLVFVSVRFMFVELVQSCVYKHEHTKKTLAIVLPRTSSAVRHKHKHTHTVWRCSQRFDCILCGSIIQNYAKGSRLICLVFNTLCLVSLYSFGCLTSIFGKRTVF